MNISVVLSGNLEASTTTGTFVMGGSVSDAGSESGSGWFAGQGQPAHG